MEAMSAIWVVLLAVVYAVGVVLATRFLWRDMFRPEPDEDDAAWIGFSAVLAGYLGLLWPLVFVGAPCLGLVYLVGLLIRRTQRASSRGLSRSQNGA